jgi:hypothetical protein
VTKQGRALRQRAEDQTDQYFYAPWADLKNGEVQDMRRLLEQLRDGLKK